MKSMRWASLALAGAIVWAVPAAAQPGPGAPGRPGFGMGGDPARRLTQLATVLDLTDSQKTSAQTIFNTAKTQAEPIATSLRETHEAVQAAVKANKADSEIDTLTARSGALTGQIAAIQAKAQRAFLALLTAQQREKLDALKSNMGPGRGPRP